jgi:hypothetical protein
MTVSHPLNAIKAFLSRFVIYPSEHELIAHTAWIVHTHLMDEWDTTPRLAFLSSEPASGKSRALEVTAQLVPRAIEPVNASPAYLFRRTASTEGRPTILHDEIDTVFGPKAKDNEDVRGFINAGYRKHSKYGRCVGNKNGQISTEDIPAYCAVAVAGLGNLPDTILSRSVIVRMKRRAPHEAVEPFRASKFEAEASAIRQHIEQWASQQKDLLVNMKPLPPEVTDRDADVWEALIAIGDCADEQWSQAIRVTAVTLVTLKREAPQSLGILLLSDIKGIFEKKKVQSISTKELLFELNNITTSPWGDLDHKELDDRRLGRFLKPYGVKSETLRGDTSACKGYKLDSFKDAFTRYIPAPSP